MAGPIDIVAVARGKWEKKFFSVLNSKEPGTGIATNANPQTYTATEAFIVIHNGENRTSGGTKSYILPDYVKFTMAVSGTAGQGFSIVWVEDTSNRWTSGGTSLTTLAANHYVDTYSGFTRVSTSAIIHVGDIASPAATSEAAVGTSQFRATVGAVMGFVGDEYTTVFGSTLPGSQPSSLQASKLFDRKMPVVLAPGSSLVGHLLIEAQTAASSYDVEVGWVEVKK